MSKEAIILTDKQYAVLLDLYHELNEVFKRIPLEYQEVFYVRLYRN